MNEKNGISEGVKEINPIDEYLERYKEQRLAEFCVQKDKEIQEYKEERLKLIEQIAVMRHKVEEYDDTWNNVKKLYEHIKSLSVDDYLKIYHMISEDVSGNHNYVSTITLNRQEKIYIWDLHVNHQAK